MKIIQDNIQK